MEVILGGEKLKTIEEFHRAMKDILELPDYYGNNHDALWDCLTGGVETPITLIWKNFNESRSYLGDFADKALLLFKDAEEEIDGFMVECR